MVARNFHDSFELLGFVGWFDIDNLKQISKEQIQEAIPKCCSMIVLLMPPTSELMSHTEYLCPFV